jgi:hypothetical protein
MLQVLRATLKISTVEKDHSIRSFNRYYFTAEKPNGEHIEFFTYYDLSRVGVGTSNTPHVGHPEDLELICQLFKEERKLIRELIHKHKDNSRTSVYETI